MVRTTIHIMRHGEVDNPQGVLYGRIPGYHLTPRGHAMAQMVADYLVETGKDITVVTTSPLERAVESGAPTAAAFGINPLRPSWGEPYTQLVARMSAAVRSALVQARGHEALLVSHQLPIWSLSLYLHGRPLAHDPRRRQCSLASLTSLTFEDNTLVGLAYTEPANALLREAEDMVPGSGVAGLKIGDGEGRA